MLRTADVWVASVGGGGSGFSKVHERVKGGDAARQRAGLSELAAGNPSRQAVYKEGRSGMGASGFCLLWISVWPLSMAYSKTLFGLFQWHVCADQQRDILCMLLMSIIRP